ncbi:QcrA and Rieske domain-containing protein [Actinocatenispora rupis]|uniref:Cytochrome bc1 complex Rieske iron-sulfur subunit n=1 Tax=Actinocatenispora rupis TaxID=519421 RepID=A0A8J3JAH3_9ACTN|nr:Rieske (2Fe-2S) protein [Actinocatenispora rupis]GID14746.1 iron-sulfur protein [Actinocatenispora rupis]
MPDTSRRRVLAAGAGIAGAAGVTALAGCGGNSGQSGTGQSGSGQSKAPSVKAGTTLVALDKVQVGQAVSAKSPDGKPLIVARPTAQTAVCFSAICTHQGCTVAPAGKELHCPCHGSVYQATTGKNVSGPAPRPLDKVDVHVANGQVVTGSA